MALPEPTPPGNAFDAQRLERQWLAMRFLRIGLVAVVAAGWFAASLPGIGQTVWPMVVLGAGLVGWLIANARSGATAREAIDSARRVIGGPATSELTEQIARVARRFTMYHAVRVMIYHQLAIVLHRQGRFDESSQVALALLALPGRSVDADTRHRLLMLLADACLRRGDLWGAYGALSDLHHSRLDLPGALQLLELQTRYQVMCGDRAAILDALTRKVAMSELMPPAVSAALHRSFGRAAHALGHAHTAKWLDDRAMLLWPSDDPATPMEPMLMPAGAIGLAGAH